MTTLRDLPPQPIDKTVRRYGPRIRELTGVCPAAIAAELGIQERTVTMIQRKLGLRPCRSPGGRTLE